MEIRAAWIVRERTSRPYSSVPNQCAALGGRSLSAMLTSYGEYGASRLAKVADATTATTRTAPMTRRSEEHTSELQSRENLVCRLLLEKKKKKEKRQKQ